MSEGMDQRPSLEQFLAAPAGDVAKVMPETIVYTPGGTRRSAVLAGISPQSDEYARWTRERMIASFDLLFRFGARHIFTTMIRPGQFAEIGRYRDRLLDWLDWGLTGPEALADYARLGWRVRLLGAESMPELQPIAERLCTATPEQSTATLWYHVIPEPGAPWQWLLKAAYQAQARTQAEAVRALYGEDVPLAKLYLTFGKPMFVADLLPPLLAGEVQCYWIQRPGYLYDEQLLRRILYDYAYLRPTWRLDKSSRYDTLEANRSLWQQPLVLGYGKHVGAFWYPELDQDGFIAGEDV
jgi:hypothetical protein